MAHGDGAQHADAANRHIERILGDDLRGIGEVAAGPGGVRWKPVVLAEQHPLRAFEDQGTDVAQRAAEAVGVDDHAAPPGLRAPLSAHQAGVSFGPSLRP